MLQCPKCGSDAVKLVIPLGGRLGCRSCSDPARTKYNAQLNQTLHNIDGKTRITRGRAFELDNRIKSPDDGRTIINRITGKPAQY